MIYICIKTFSDCSCAQLNEHISVHHYKNFYENLFHFYYTIRYSISVNTNFFIQYKMSSAFATAADRKKLQLYLFCSMIS